MVTNSWIENSRKAYSALLNLYPREHHNEYGISMLQVFTEQCRSAYEQKNLLGIILLWLRTLPDLGHTALLEHLTSPRAAWGLMEPVPNAPLPWKGIFLILLPGLVYLVSQVAQLTGEPWYLTVYYRAAFLLILPVLAVWAITRRFPIWGLIPLGLLYRLLQEIGYQLIVLHPGVFSSNPLLNLILDAAKMVQNELFILVVFFVIATLALGWRYLRQQHPSRSFWIWLGIYLLMTAAQIGARIGWALYYSWEENNTFLPKMAAELSLNILRWDAYNASALLLLIFIGTLLMRRHGFFAILVPIGYMLPAIVVGVGWFDNSDSSTGSLMIASLAIMAYRLLLSFIGPVWMSRSSVQADKKRAVLVSLILALGIHIAMQFYLAFGIYQGGYPPQAVFIVIQDTVLAELMLISAMVLAVVAYQQGGPTVDTPAASPEFRELPVTE